MKTTFFLLLNVFLYAWPALSQDGKTGFRTIEIFRTTEARQGVAVDANYFYTINSRGIAKHDKENGSMVLSWKDTTGKIIHLDGGVIIGDKLFCAHSNYPGIPMTSSIEIFSAKDLKHTGSHSFGIKYGSCTWADYHDNSWWVCFAHYDQFRNDLNKGSESTVLVRFDSAWNEKESWTFPPEIVSEIRPMSVSGGSWGPDNKLYVTGHDSAEVYIMKLPRSGTVLEYLQSARIDSHGQGIAWDRIENNRLYGITRKDNSVVVSEPVRVR
jgi:hypothetical protein